MSSKPERHWSRIVLQLNIRPEEDRPLRVLCLGAHSDDIEIGCGASLAALSQGRSALDMRWVVFSGNEARHEEARRSFECWSSDVERGKLDLHDFRDGFFPDQWALIKERFIRLKDAFEPDILFTHFREDLHQDHRVVNELTWNCFRDHLVLEYEVPKYDGDMGRPNFFIPVSEGQANAKVAALTKHFGSQRSKQWFSKELFLGLMRLRGAEAGSASGYAEAFHSRKSCLKIR